jgi:hypothetical protein
MAYERETRSSGGSALGEPGARAGVARVLVVANETIGGRELLDEIARHAGRDSAIRVVAPALVRSRLRHGLGDVDDAIEEARDRLETSLAAMRGRGWNVTGDVGDADPNLAMLDALRVFPADEVIISTHPRERSAWLEKDVVERARREIDRPITHVVVDLEAEPGTSEVQGVRELKPDPGRLDRGDYPDLDYLPPLTVKDRVTLAVAAFGTIGLILLAAECGGCAPRLLIALGGFMISIWHAIALLLFRSAGYRGPWATVAADVVLFGMPPAIILSVLLG